MSGTSFEIDARAGSEAVIVEWSGVHEARHHMRYEQIDWRGRITRTARHGWTKIPGNQADIVENDDD